MSENIVDLPAPFSPRRTAKVPRGTVSETLSSTRFSPKLWLTPRTERAGASASSRDRSVTGFQSFFSNYFAALVSLAGKLAMATPQG